MARQPSPADDSAQDRTPPPAALLRDFVNTLDHELGTDELATTAGLTDFLVGHGLLAGGATAGEAEREASVRLREGLHAAFELNHAAEEAPLTTFDDTLGTLSVRLQWDGGGVAVAPAEDGVAGALTRIALAAHAARASDLWWRLKICAFDECRWAYYDQSKNRSRHYCEYGCGNKLKTRAYRARRRADQRENPAESAGGL
ncbi:MAG TPA: CGNR zinc finger domain-containing protein [Nocardioides sp.]|uniref:CGNR zinc finger domain-containing protein n=1 Tax=Nocardioides sp. TaxID=35761 RepID=UPI002C172B77|nr:CGNR zinc finger domain-containing protein [Nocardioides sp.]HTW17906.1 CGNR zinc finger domain-containing protein [Nocardioides sp.]